MRRRIAFLVSSPCSPVVCGDGSGRARTRPPRGILSGEPTTLDPAAQGDAGERGDHGPAVRVADDRSTRTSQLRPALAESWRSTTADGRSCSGSGPDLTFSDGSPLRASDVVRSWLRLIDPDRPSPLAIARCSTSRAPRATSTATALTADASDCTPTTRAGDGHRGPASARRPSSSTIVAGPTFGVVPPGVDGPGGGSRPGAGFVASGGYTLASTDDTASSSTANPLYWAGQPAITTITSITDLGGASPVEASRAATSTTRRSSASTRRGSPTTRRLGPQLRVGRRRCRSSTTASTRASRRSTTCGSARRSARPSTGGGSPRSACPTRR